MDGTTAARLERIRRHEDGLTQADVTWMCNTITQADELLEEIDDKGYAYLEKFGSAHQSSLARSLGR